MSSSPIRRPSPLCGAGRSWETVGRYAPSPTGPLHLGNLLSALLAWLQARLAGGRFILRMEDLDQPRVRAGSASRILADLRWLGLDWDEGPDVGGPNAPYDQSKRNEYYQAALDWLRESGAVFACYCSRKDIAAAVSAPHGRQAVYPGTCRPPAGSVASAVAASKKKRPSWRYRVDERKVAFEDPVLGLHSQNLAVDVGDFVVRRADGLFAYQLAVVVDDALMGITDVVRGSDLLDSTPRQIELLRALGLAPPRYWHTPLMVDREGRRLAKRDGSDSLEELRRAGATPEEVVGLLAGSLGWVKRGEAITARDLLSRLDPIRFRENLRATGQCRAPD